MNIKVIDGSTLIKMIRAGAANLEKYKDMINKLNVFPVPDGDTGTNMNLTMSSGLKALNEVEDERLSTVGRAFIQGLLMGARGNSGVILSQLFRGFAKYIEEIAEINCDSLAIALERGVESAYKSVTNPVEGTILTVAKDAAKIAKEEAEKTDDLIELMEKIIAEANASLKRTPDLLPILKEVGVVDSGGKGLVVIYEGFLAALKGEEIVGELVEESMETMVDLEHQQAVQSFIDIGSIEFGYCTEFIVEFDEEKLANNPFDEQAVRQKLSEYGDSLLIAADQDFFKVHIHAEHPGEVMTYVQQFGDLTNIDIENMRKQYKDIVKENERANEVGEEKEIGIITVAAGAGMKNTFTSIGASTVIEGGQTMNPSTEDFIKAIKRTNAKTTFILPNNSNIILAANQAAEISDREVIVLPTKSIPQGISALFVFDQSASNEENKEAMTEAIQQVKTGHVTYAIRDTVINGIEIKEGNYMGLDDKSIKVTNTDKLETLFLLMDDIVDEDNEIVTIFYGEDVTEEQLENIETKVAEKYDDIEVELHAGNQPVYSFILMVE